MSETKEVKKAVGPRSHERSIKIQSRNRESFDETVGVPEIRLCGIWLQEHGFCKGRRVIVTPMKEQLILTLQCETE